MSVSRIVQIRHGAQDRCLQQTRPQYEAHFGFVCFAQKLTSPTLGLTGRLEEGENVWAHIQDRSVSRMTNSDASAVLNIAEARRGIVAREAAISNGYR
jgi:hypothetical protein